MPNVISLDGRIPAMTDDQIYKVKRLSDRLKEERQIDLYTYHTLHGGMYARTIHLDAGSVIAGALIKVPTTLIINGDCTVYIGDDAVRIAGYEVIACSANRKQAFVIHASTMMTMMFRTDARTVEEAESEFTDEADQLLSRSESAMNNIIIGDFL